MISVKPGGWLVDEEFDSASLLADPAANAGELLPPETKIQLKENNSSRLQLLGV